MAFLNRVPEPVAASALGWAPLTSMPLFLDTLAWGWGLFPGCMVLAGGSGSQAEVQISASVEREFLEPGDPCSPPQPLTLCGISARPHH